MNAQAEIYKYNLSILEDLKNTSHLLEKCYGVKFLTYRKFRNDGLLFHISSEPAWLDCSLKHDFLISNSSLSRMKTTRPGKLTPFLWPKTPKDDKTYQALFENDFWNGITVYEKFQNQIELWAFTTSKNNDAAPQLYINHFDIIERFILFFKQKHYNIITNNNKNLLVKTNIIEHIETINMNEKQNEFIEQTPLKKFVVKDILGNNQSISRREAQSVFYLAHGYTIKAIARKITVGERAIEDYIKNAKIKLRCITTDQLITHINHCILDDIFLD